MPDIDFSAPYASARSPVMGRAAIATSQPLASMAGMEMLQAGGNAVDAAVAAAMALTVVEPTGCGIGSDAFAILWDNGRLHGLNASGRAPASWSAERFRGLGAMPELGWDSVTVPGVVSGWVALLERFGRLGIQRVAAPAIRYAREGFISLADGHPLMAFGLMGGPMQAQGHVQLADRILVHGQNPQAASDAPRWRLLSGRRIAVEPDFDRATCEALAARGHEIVVEQGAGNFAFGGAQIVLRHGETYVAGSDHRKDGQAITK